MRRITAAIIILALAGSFAWAEAMETATVGSGEVTISPQQAIALQSTDSMKRKYELGVTYGVLAGASCLNAEIRFPLASRFGFATTALRQAVGYAQSRDTGARYVPLQVDLVLNYPPGVFSGVANYIGFGVNYVVVTTGRVSGALGGEAFYGVESEGFGGKLFGELGYSILRTGFSPAHYGVTVLVGYRK
ncbi:MAG: hypothetical protein ABH823_02370 [bacterium]